MQHFHTMHTNLRSLQLLDIHGGLMLNFYLMLTKHVLDVESACIAGDWQHVPLLRQVLHGGGNIYSESFYENIINSAPCEGPSCFWNSGGACSTFEWASSNRLRNPDERNGGSADAEYNGIDYMLYYNLYNIINPSTIPYVNFMDSRITFPIPIGNPLMGTTANPLTIEAFNTKQR